MPSDITHTETQQPNEWKYVEVIENENEPGLVPLVDDLFIENTYLLEVDGTLTLDWDIKLTPALWAYRTTYKVTTRTTPFALMYGIEAILPIEFEVQSLRIAIDERLDDSDSLRDRLERLKALSESRRMASQHVEVIQRRRKVAFDKRNKVRTLQPGMWVMVQDARKLEFPGKFDALWTGPYIIQTMFPNNSLQLKTLDGSEFPTRTNGSQCKEYKV